MLDDIRKAKSNVLLVGDRISLVSALRADTKDILFLNFYNFTIDDAHALQNIVSKNESNNKLIVISFFIASPESQNAMLKTLEDNTRYQFVIIVEDINSLIKTIRSRLMYLSPHIVSVSGDIDKVFIQNFLKMSIFDRLKNKEIQGMIDKRVDADDDKSAKAKDDARAFIIALASELLKIYKQEGSEPLHYIIKELNSLAHYILKNGSSQKLIIEYICYRL